MSDSVIDTLVLDLLEWIGPGPRPVGEVLDAWRTSCPRLAIWEEANDRGFIVRQLEPGCGQVVLVSDAGRAYLGKAGRVHPWKLTRQPQPPEPATADGAPSTD